jgi:tRNA pseudouridine synthase 9
MFMVCLCPNLESFEKADPVSHRFESRTFEFATQPNTRPPLSPLAQTPRVIAHLIRKGKILPSAMALAVVEQPTPKDKRLPPPNPPEVITTPCGDPWPKPYFFQDGLRRVEPYHFTYNTNVKERWRGREILDIFASEFRDRPEEYYVCARVLTELLYLLTVLILDA